MSVSTAATVFHVMLVSRLHALLRHSSFSSGLVDAAWQLVTVADGVVDPMPFIFSSSPLAINKTYYCCPFLKLPANRRKP
jgi:hypothetical protein